MFLWNNGAAMERLADWQVDSTANIGCWPRWWMAARSTTEFVASWDDDLLPADDKLLADVVDSASAVGPQVAMGAFGVRLRHGVAYRGCEHVSEPPIDTPVDIVKGRVLVMRASVLRRAFTCVSCASADDEDDIALCGALASGRERPHLLSAVFRGRLRELPQHGVGLVHRPDHYARRERAREEWFTMAKSSWGTEEDDVPHGDR